jgi:hypothetical protein
MLCRSWNYPGQRQLQASVQANDPDIEDITVYKQWGDIGHKKL